MGVYNVSEKELLGYLEEALNNIQGDFTRKDLVKVLNKLKKYEFVVEE